MNERLVWIPSVAGRPAAGTLRLLRRGTSTRLAPKFSLLALKPSQFFGGDKIGCFSWETASMNPNRFRLSYRLIWKIALRCHCNIVFFL